MGEQDTIPVWRRSWLVVLLTSLVLPPLGFVLLWLRPWRAGAPVWRHVAAAVGRLALSAVFVILTLVYAVRLGVLHMEMSGAGFIPIFTFRNPQADQEALERHREQQRAAAPANTEPAAATGATQASAATVPPAGFVQTKPAAATPASERSAGVSPAGLESAAPTPGAYWTDFRGPNRDGVYTETPILTAWPADGLKPLWRQPIGGGYASFVVAQGRAFTIEQRRSNEVVAAYDVETGRELWTNSWPTLFSESMGGDGPRATPTWHEGRIYALGAAGELRCLNAQTGKVIWSRNILSDNGATNLPWGMAASPLIVDDKVIVQPGGRNGRSVVAYDARTGEAAWRALDDQQAYTSPMVVTLAGKRQLLTVTGERILGMTVENGSLLWSFPWTTMYGINSAQPIVVDANRVFVSAGYDHGAVLLEITANDGKFSAQPVWQNNSMKNRFNASVLYQGHIYGFDESIFACIDARTGQRKWKGGRYGYGQVLLAPNGSGQSDGHLIVLTESGDLVLIKASPDGLQEVARFSAIEGKTWNLPALAGGILLVRNEREMAAFRLTK